MTNHTDCISRTALRSVVERMKEQKNLDAMIRMGDLSFGNYTPTQIYIRALNTVLAHLDSKEEEIRVPPENFAVMDYKVEMPPCPFCGYHPDEPRSVVAELEPAQKNVDDAYAAIRENVRGMNHGLHNPHDHKHLAAMLSIPVSTLQDEETDCIGEPCTFRTIDRHHHSPPQDTIREEAEKAGHCVKCWCKNCYHVGPEAHCKVPKCPCHSPREESGERCENCLNDRHDSCTGCICHSDY